VVDLAAAYLGAVLLHALVVELMRRPRPPAPQALVHAPGWGYPSGHTTQAVAAWRMLLVLLARGRGPGTRALLILGVTAIVLLVGSSRIYLGAHWLTDVLGGAALGGGWLAVLPALRQFSAAQRNDSHTAVGSRDAGERVDQSSRGT
jgi:membrane-associated phospholipid phosphatase